MSFNRKFRFILLSGLLLFSGNVYSQEVIVGFEKKDIPVLNDELSKIRKDLESINEVRDADGDTKIQTEKSADEDIIRMDTAGTERWVMTAAGERTMPTQPAFLVSNSAAQNNIATGGNVTVVFDTEITDQGNDFASNTFTAPVAGSYQLNVTVNISNIDSASTSYIITIVGSNRSIDATFDPRQFAGDVAGEINFSPSVLLDMDAGDTVSVAFNQASGAAQSDIAANQAYFSGFLAF